MPPRRIVVAPESLAVAASALRAAAGEIQESLAAAPSVPVLEQGLGDRALAGRAAGLLALWRQVGGELAEATTASGQQLERVARTFAAGEAALAREMSREER